MSVIFFSGFETGDISEWASSSGTPPTADSTNPRGGGGYSLKIPWNNGNFYVATGTGGTNPAAYLRFGFYATAAGGASVGWLAMLLHAGGVVGAIRTVTDGGGGIYLRLFNNITGLQVGSDYQIQSNSWYTVQLKIQISATVGVLEMMVNGIVVATGSNLNTGANNIDALQMGNQFVSGSGATGNIWFDDVMIRNDQYPGEGYCIARQGNTTAPNYNAWTKTGGTNIWQVWDATPFSTAANASATTTGNEQTMVVDFTTVGGTGSTGHGTGLVGTWDVINAFKVGAVGNTSSTTSDSSDSAVFRTPAGGGGSDTTVTLNSSNTQGGGIKWKTTNSYLEAYIPTPTLAQVQNCEVGLSKGTGSNTHTAQDVWAMVDFLPVPYTMFGGSETEPYTPLSFETLIEDSGEEQAWYFPLEVDLAALISTQIITTLFIFDDNSDWFSEDEDTADYYPTGTDDVTAAAITFPLPTFIFESGSRTFAELSDADYYPPIDTDPSLFLNSLGQDIVVLTIASQWDNAVPDADEYFVEESEGDYYPDFSIDLGWYFVVTPSVNVLLIFNDFSIDDLDQLDENAGFQSSPTTYGILFGASENLIFDDYSPSDTDQLLEESDVDYYPPIDADASLVNITLVTELFAFNEYVPAEADTLIEDSDADLYPDFSDDLSWYAGATPVAQAQLVFNDYMDLADEVDDPADEIDATQWSSPIFIIILGVNENFIVNDYTDYLDLYTDDTGDDAGYDPLYDAIEWYFAQSFPPLASITLIFNDYSPVDAESLIEESEGDYYPDFAYDMSGWLLETTINISFVFNDFTPQDIDELLEESETDYYPPREEELQWLIITLVPAHTTLFGDWTYIALNGQLPTVQPHGGIEFFGGGYGGAFWSNTAFTGTHALQIQTNFGGTLGWDSSIPSDNFIITGNELFTVYYTIVDNVPDQIEVQLYEGNSQSWFIVYLGVDSFGLGGVSKGTIPNVEGFWITVTFTAADLGLVAGNVITGLAWGVYNQTGISNVIFSDTLVIETVVEDSVASSEWYNQTADYLEVYSEDTEDYYPDFSIDDSWYFAQSISQFSLSVFNDVAPDIYEDDSGDDTWYDPQDDFLSWFYTQISIPTILVFTDYAPQDTDELIEDLGDDQAWYSPYQDFILLSISPNLVLVASQWDNQDVDYLELYSEDFGDEDTWYHTEGDISPFAPFPARLWSIVYRVQPTLNFTKTAAIVVNAQLGLDDDILEESDADYYPDFSIDLTWYFVSIPVSVAFIYNEYIPYDTDELIDDTGEEQAWYPPVEELLSWFIPGQITPTLVFNDYIPSDTDQLIDDIGDDQAWYPPVEELLSWFIPGQIIVTLVFNDFAPDIYEDDTSEDQAWYPAVDDFLSWFYTNLSQSPALIFNDFAPEVYDDDTGDDTWYDPQDDFLSWFYTNITLPIVLVFNDYAPQETDQLIEDSEGDFYPDTGIDNSWYFKQSVLPAYIFTEYAPLELEQLIDDSGEEQAWYPPQDDFLSWFYTNLSQPVFLIFIDYSPLELDQVVEDIGDEQAWYPAQEDIITPTLFTQQLLDTGLEDYSPLEVEQVTEESEGDYYPDFGIDLGWYFNQIGPPLVSAPFIFNEYNPADTDQLIEDLGDEQAWYPAQEDILTPAIFTHLLLDVGLEDYSPEPWVDDDTAEEQAWYPAIDDTLSWFYARIPLPTFLVFNEYNPLELEQLTEDAGDDTWYDPREEQLTWFIPFPPIPVSLVFNDYAPVEIDPLLDDTSEEQAWYPPQDELLSWFIPKAQSLNLVFNEYAPLELEQLLDDTSEEQSWYPPQEELLQWFIVSLIPPPFIINDYAPLEAETLTEESEGDYYPSFDVSPVEWFFVLGANVLIIITSTDVIDDPNAQLLDVGDEDAWYHVESEIPVVTLKISVIVLIGASQWDNQAADYLELYSEESEGDYYPTQEEQLSWFIPHPTVNQSLIFTDYSPLELEQLTEESEGDYYPSFDVDLSSIFFLIPPPIGTYISALQWDAIPLDMETVTDDLGVDLGWYSEDINLVLIGFIKYQLFMPLFNVIQLYFNLTESTNTNTEIIYGG